MLVAPLSSGSAGNAYWFESEGTAILVDAGIGPRESKKRLALLGRDIHRLSAIVVTHEHYDHIRGAERIARRYEVPIYLTRGTLAASTIDTTDLKTVVFENDTSFTIGELQVHARKTIHDAVDPSCFVIEARDGTRVGIASDLGYVNGEVIRHLSGCDGLFFESNHDLDMLRAGTYPWSLKRRIMSRFGHLSNDDSVHAVQRLLGADLKTLCMIHLSQKNNHESIVREMCTRLLRRTGASIEFSIAKQFEPTGLFDVARRRPRNAPPGQMSLF
ncbi:MAG TPA: MBL fold metallo-hydrolase [Thermoanaerobaculia bacterium]|jgi:phosphoribosyl 1,2-cyclic phosphodiesterase|nr:MBL fold metallo-hydrolase [Thermoanaerobaculia bacterium]